MDPIAQLEEIKGRSNPIISTAIRGVQGGYVVTGQVQFADKATGGILASVQAEGVAGSPQQAVTMTLNYHLTGSFDSAQLSFDQTTLGAPTGQNALGQPASI